MSRSPKPTFSRRGHRSNSSTPLPRFLPFRRNYRAFIILATAFIAFITFSSSYDIARFWTIRSPSDIRAQKAINKVGKRKVVVYDRNRFHDEVHGAVLYTLRQFPEVDILFYRQSWRYGFERAIESFWTEYPRQPEQLLVDMKDPEISAFIFTTCDWDFPKIKDEMHAEWRRRDDGHKFTVVCLRHWTTETNTQDMESFATWESASMLGLGGHVNEFLEDTILNAVERSQSKPEMARGLAGMKSKVYIPTFPPDRPINFTSPIDHLFGDGQISTGLLQSTFWDEKHRALARTFNDLLVALKADPSVWGYAAPVKGSDRYTIVPDAVDPFRLVFLGAGDPPVPEPLKDMAIIIKDADYAEYYHHIKAADIVIPAFGTDGYEVNRASSTVGVAGTAMTPLLVTEAVNKSYGYFCPGFAVVRPPGVSEIEYIRRVRAKQISWPSRQQMEAQLAECRDEWRLSNMETLAELIVEPFSEDLGKAREAYLEFT